MQCIGEVVGDDYLVLVYGYINGDGKLETGTTKFYRKKGKLPDPPKVWEVSLVVDSNVREEMKFTPQTEIIKRTFPAPSKGLSAKNVTDNGVTEIERNAEFCNLILTLLFSWKRLIRKERNFIPRIKFKCWEILLVDMLLSEVV